METAARWPLLPVAVGLGLAYVVPMAFALHPAFTGTQAWRWLVDDYARHRIAGGFLQAILSLAACLVVAVPIAVLHTRWRIPGSKALLALHAAPFALPVFVVVAGLRQTFGAGGWSDAILGVDVLTTLGPWGAVVLGNAYYNTGLAAMLLHTAFLRRPRRLEDAAALLGASPNQTRLRVTGPLLRPALLVPALLAFLFSFASFGVVLLLGQGHVDTLDTLLYANLRGAFPREDRGAVLAIAQIAIQVALLACVLGLERRAARLTPDPQPRATSHPLATTIAWVLALVGLVPALAVLVGAFQVQGHWSLAAWTTLLDPGAPGHLAGFSLVNAVRRSLAYAGAAVLGSLALTLMLGLARRGPVARAAEALAFLPLGTSSVVLGFAYLLAFTGRAWLPAVGSVWPVVAAHTLVAFPLVARTVLPAVRGLDRRLDHASSTLGASLAQRLWRVHLPVLRGPLVVACGFAAVLSLGDLGASLLLMTDDLASLTVWIQRHGGPGAFDPLARAQSTALAALLLLLTLAVFAVAGLLYPRRRAA